MKTIDTSIFLSLMLLFRHVLYFVKIEKQHPIAFGREGGMTQVLPFFLPPIELIKRDRSAVLAFFAVRLVLGGWFRF